MFQWTWVAIQFRTDYVLFAASSRVFWRRQWHPIPVLLPGKSHGQRSLVGCSPWGCWESDTTERLHFHVSLSCIGEGNGNPLQCSCLENPRDGGPGGLPSVGLHRVRHDWSDLAVAAAAFTHWGTVWNSRKGHDYLVSESTLQVNQALGPYGKHSASLNSEMIIRGSD